MSYACGIAAVLVVFVGVVAWTRYISMGSIMAAACFPLAVWLIDEAADMAGS